MTYRILVGAVALVHVISAAPLSAQDAEAGAKLYKKECRSCHGPKAQGMASFPKLVGQPIEYLAGRLEAYRAGEKIGPNTPLMAPRAKNLSDEDIANITTFITTVLD